MPTVPTQTTQQDFGQVRPAYDNANATPDAFGAQIGAATQRLGAAVEQGADAAAKGALAFQSIKNETDVNDQYYKNYFPAVTKLTQSYLATGGKDAVDQLPVYQQQVEELREQQRNQFGNPAAQRMFDEMSRRLNMFQLDGAARHAQQQQRQYEDETSQGMVDASRSLAVQRWNDPVGFNVGLQSGVQEIMSHAAYRGQPYEWAQHQVQAFTSQTYADRLRTMATAGTAQAALELLKNGENYADSQGVSRHVDIASQILPEHLPSLLADLSTQAADQIGASYGSSATAGIQSAIPGIRNNNPGNLRDPKTGQFQSFATQQQGVAAADANLLAYQTKYGIDTISGIVNRWAPKGDGNNDPAAYAASVSKATGIAADQKIDLSNAATRSKVLTAMFDVETPGWRNPSALGQTQTGGSAPTIASLVATQAATSQAASQSAQDHVLQLTGNPAAAIRAGEMAAKTVELNTGAAIKQQQAQQANAQSYLSTALAGNALTGQKPMSSVGDLLADPQAYASYRTLSPEGQAQFVERLTKGIDPPVNAQSQGTFYRLYGEAFNDPIKFSGEDLSQYFNQLPHSMVDQLIKLQGATAGRAQRDQNKAMNLEHAMTVSRPMLMAAGVRLPNAKSSPEQAADYNAFTGRMSQALDQFYTTNKRGPNDKELRDISNSLLVQGAQSNTAGMFPWSSDKSVRAFQVDSSSFYVPVPDAEKPKVQAAYKQAFGRLPTDSETQDFYTKYTIANAKGK